MAGIVCLMPYSWEDFINCLCHYMGNETVVVLLYCIVLYLSYKKEFASGGMINLYVGGMINIYVRILYIYSLMAFRGC